MTPLRCAIVGYGSAAKTLHLPLIGFEPRIAVHGIVARKADVREAIVRERGCRAYASVEEMLADDAVELVVIATPHDSHAPVAIAALNAGKHVVTDKPMCLTLDEYRAMRDAADRSGKLLTVFHNLRFSGDFLTLQSIVPKLGDLRWLELSWNRHGLSKRSAWRNASSEAGGRLIDLGVHAIDQVLQVIPDRVLSVTTRMNRDWPGADVESACLIVIAFEGGRTATIDVGSMTRVPKPKYLAVGTRATWVKPGGLSDPQDAALSAGSYADFREDQTSFGTLVDDAGPTTTPTLPGDWRVFYANVADAIRNGAKPLVTVESMGRVIGVMAAAIASSRDGRPVEP